MSVQRRIVIGTDALIIANPNPQRRRMDITFLPSAIESGNTGRIHIGKGFPPSATLGDANQGDIINAGSAITDAEAYKDDPTVFKGAWWARASASGQIIVVDEQ